MVKKTIKPKQKYWFWRWIILSVIRFNRLYFLVWGILFLSMIVCFKADIAALLERFFR